MSTTFEEGVIINSTVKVTSTSATAFTVAASGTNYGLQVDESSGSAATGLKIKPAAAGSGLALSTISSGTNENLTIDAKGTGSITVGGTSTGNVKLAANNAIEISGSDGSATFTSSNDDAWVFNTTAANGGWIEYRRSGSGYGRIGQATGISGGNTDFQIMAQTGTLYLGASQGQVLPNGDNATNLGSATGRWAVVYAANGTIQTSDLREKNVVGDSLGLDFIEALKPIAFRWKKDDLKVRYGLAAQDVLEVAPQGTFVHDDNPDCLGMNYAEFIGPLVKSVQELSAKVQELRNRVLDL